MNDKWKQRKLVLNREKMVKNMAQIQDLMNEISKVPFNPDQKDVDKFTDFKEYAENFLNLIKLER
tara:strand:- start:250 stop:444 length:195 start_codon:yes stop_codon:yes gene_type:complete